MPHSFSSLKDTEARQYTKVEANISDALTGVTVTVRSQPGKYIALSPLCWELGGQTVSRSETFHPDYCFIVLFEGVKTRL